MKALVSQAFESGARRRKSSGLFDVRTMRRRTPNEIVCAGFRELLTQGFYTVDQEGEINEHDSAAIAATKEWRGDLWKAFRDLEDRLCPVAAFEAGRR